MAVYEKERAVESLVPKRVVSVSSLFERLVLVLAPFWRDKQRVTLFEAQVDSVIEHAGDTVRLVDPGPPVLAHIACWHTQIKLYRGYVCYLDESELTFIMDPTCTYLTHSSRKLVCAVGLEHARNLIDALLQQSLCNN
jgi:hypothetical protein